MELYVEAMANGSGVGSFPVLAHPHIVSAYYRRRIMFAQLPAGFGST